MSAEIVNHETGEILSADEAARLRVKENAIERGADEVAKALAAIRDERLYRAEYSTFEAYCQERWGMTRQHVNRQIVAAEVAAILEPIGSKPNVEQAKALADLRDDPEALRETYRQAQEATGGNVTAKAIRDVRNPEPTFVSASDALAEIVEDDDPTFACEIHAPGDSACAWDCLGKTFVSADETVDTETGEILPRLSVVPSPGGRPTPSKPKRRPLPDAARDAGWDLRKSVERLERIAADDRFNANKQQVAPQLRGHLENAIEVLTDLLDRINNN